MAKKTAAARLDAARAALAEIEARLAEAARVREDSLLAGAAVADIAKIDEDIADLQHAERTERDRIRLLEASAEREEQDRRIKERLGLIQRVEALLEKRDAAAAELQELIAKADAAFRRLIKFGVDLRAAWPWQPHDWPPTIIGDRALVHAVENEIYRVGSRPRLYGGMDPPGTGINFPGGKSPRIEWIGQPERIKPLVDVVREASAYASTLMRSGKIAGDIAPAAAPATNGSGHIEPPVDAPSPAAAADGPTLQPSHGRTAAEAQLGDLLQRLAVAGDNISEAGEAKYQALLRQVAQLQAEVAAENQIGGQHG